MSDKSKPATAKPIKNDKTVLKRTVVSAPSELPDDDLGAVSGGNSYRPGGRYIP